MARVVSTVRVPDELHGRDGFGVVLSGHLRVDDTGIHTFCVTSNDGSTLRIGYELVVDNDGIHPARERCGEVALAAGEHPIEIVYFEDGGSEALSLTHRFGASRTRAVEPAQLRHR